MRITGLFVYPIKSCRGTALDSATLTPTGLQHDRRWMLVDANHRFITQREHARMALIHPVLHHPAAEVSGMTVNAPGMEPLTITGTTPGEHKQVTVWRDTVGAVDEGDEAAAWFSAFLQLPVRLVRFDDASPRHSDKQWTGGITSPYRFADGFALLLIGQSSLDDLNARLGQAIPMTRFRPNIVVADLPAYGEDHLHEFGFEAVQLRAVKPCTRCKITTIDQQSGQVTGFEPLTTLMQYRRNAELRGVMFGQNVIILRGAGESLTVGQSLQPTT